MSAAPHRSDARARSLAITIALFGAVLAPAGAVDAPQARAVGAFDRIRVDGAFTVQVTAGAPRTSVAVSGPADAVALVTTDVRDRTLFVGMRSPGHSLGHAPRVTIALPALRGFTNEGAGSMTIGGLTGGDIDVANSGAASIVLSGRAARETISLNGTGLIDASRVHARDVAVDNNGVGNIRVRASGMLRLSVNGVGEIRYAGNPAHVQSQVNGVGRIAPL